MRCRTACCTKAPTPSRSTCSTPMPTVAWSARPRRARCVLPTARRFRSTARGDTASSLSASARRQWHHGCRHRARPRCTTAWSHRWAISGSAARCGTRANRTPANRTSTAPCSAPTEKTCARSSVPGCRCWSCSWRATAMRRPTRPKAAGPGCARRSGWRSPTIRAADWPSPSTSVTATTSIRRTSRNSAAASPVPRGMSSTARSCRHPARCRCRRDAWSKRATATRSRCRSAT